MEEMAAAAAATTTAEKASSYRYWVREATGDAAPLPVPCKLDPVANGNGNGNPPPLGSVWNQAGTWEEKNLNSWANTRIKDLLGSLGSLEFPTGKASVDEVSKCSGDTAGSGETSGIDDRIIKMIKNWYCSGETILVGKSEHKLAIETELKIACRCDEVAFEVMWGLENQLHILVPDEELELREEGP